MRNKIISIAILCSVIFNSQAETIASLKKLCNPGAEVTLAQDYFIEGIVISDWRSPNMDLNQSITVNRLNIYENDATAYVQDADGSCGVRLVFDEYTDNRLCKGDRVKINVKGCRLSRNLSPDCITLRGLSWLNVESAIHGPEAAPKEKAVSELTDNDIYTLVSLTDLEFVFKEGSYADIYEKYAPYCPAIHRGVCDAISRMDGWASLLRDSRGSNIYMLINMLCEWRRNGKGVPQGIGSVDGIIVHTPMRRYGGDMGRYSIRPIDESYIKIGKKRSSNWSRLTAWVQDGTSGQSLEFEMLGYQEGLYKNGRKGDRVLNDIGPAKGYLWTDSDAYTHVSSDLNALSAEKEGYVPNGAIAFIGTGTGWYEFDNNGNALPEGKSILIEFDARKAKGEIMTLNFSWLAGNQNAESSWGFPAQWKVQCSIDGHSWATLKENATGQTIFHLRPHPWMDKKLEGLGMRRTGFDTALGMQQRSFILPVEAFGEKTVFLRITPASDMYYAHRGNAKDSSADPNKRMKASMKEATSMIRFGEISIDYK